MRNYYVLSNARVRREQNTLYIEQSDGTKRPLPIEDVDSLYLYGEVDLNTKLLNFLAQRRVACHVFNYYGFYSGSFYPREYLHSGFLLVRQTHHYGDILKRFLLAREIVSGAAHSIDRNLRYYIGRRGGKTTDDEDERMPVVDDTIDDPANPTPEVEAAVDAALAAPLLTEYAETPDPDGAYPDPPIIPEASDLLPVPASLLHASATVSGLAGVAMRHDGTDINYLRGVEGKMRVTYYDAWKHIVKPPAGSDAATWSFDRRVRRPPDNEINSLISFGNSHLYTVCLSELYRTQLTPTISYLHEPGARRFSLALDLSEIFKPLIVDRALFRLLNTGQLSRKHFHRDGTGCFLNDDGRKLVVGELEKRLSTTIKHRRLNRHVSYRHLIRLECYKLIRHLTDVENYRAFRAWW